MCHDSFGKHASVMMSAMRLDGVLWVGACASPDASDSSMNRCRLGFNKGAIRPRERGMLLCTVELSGRACTCACFHGTVDSETATS